MPPLTMTVMMKIFPIILSENMEIQFLYIYIGIIVHYTPGMEYFVTLMIWPAYIVESQHFNQMNCQTGKCQRSTIIN